MTNTDREHQALPKLYGAPAYARPKVLVEPVDRPFDPDSLPIEAERTDGDHQFVREFAGQSYTSAGYEAAPRSPRVQQTDAATSGGFDGGRASAALRPRAFRLGAIAQRLRPPSSDGR